MKRLSLDLDIGLISLEFPDYRHCLYVISKVAHELHYDLSKMAHLHESCTLCLKKRQ